jgi:adenine-specific DNA-methyltransferase
MAAPPPTDRLARLRELAPEAFVGDELDWSRLPDALGVSPPPERYGLGFAGKADALRQVELKPSGTLRPAPTSSDSWQTTGNVLVEGDNLEVLRLLQRSLPGQVGLIYIDPPYNTGQDFVYSDDFRDPLQSYLRQTGQSGAAKPVDVAGRYHSRWLAMMLPRLHLARRLLRQDGVLLVSIDEHEHRNLVLLLCEIFGEECHLGDFIWKKKSGGGSDASAMVLDHEYVVAFGRSASARLHDDPLAEVETHYAHRDERGAYSLERLDKQNLGYEPSLDFPIEGPDGAVYRVAHKDPDRKQARWRWSQRSVTERYGELVFRKGNVYTRNYQKPGARPRSLLVDRRFGRTRTGRADLVSLFGAEVLEHPKPVRLLRHLIRIASSPDDLVLDFFAGSGTTGHAVLAGNAEEGTSRRFVLVQLPEPCPAGSLASSFGLATIADITRERIRRATAALPPARPEEDRGCRVFRLAASCWRPWSGSGDPKGELLAHADAALPDRSEQDRLWELLITAGRPLTERLETIDESTWRTADGRLICSLAPAVDGPALGELLDREPEEIILADRAFDGDDSLRLQASIDAARRGVRLRTV